MSLSGISLSTGATITPSGGTAFVLNTDGKNVSNGIHLIESAAASYLLMKSATFAVRRAALQKNGDYSKRIGSFSVVIPASYTLNGVTQTTYSVVRGSVEVHPAIDAAGILDIRKIGAQVLLSTSADAFFNNQAIV